MPLFLTVAGFLIGFAPGLYLARAGRVALVVVFALVAAAVAGWAWSQAQGAGITEGPAAFGMFLFMMLAPVVTGLVVGGAMGLYLRGRDGQGRTDDQKDRHR